MTPPKAALPWTKREMYENKNRTFTKPISDRQGLADSPDAMFRSVDEVASG